MISNSKPSSIINAVEYNPETLDLTVTLHGGKTYIYPDTSAEEHNAFVSADSHGKHFSAVVSKRPHRPKNTIG